MSEQTKDERTKSSLKGLDGTCVVPGRDFVELVTEHGVLQNKLRVFCGKQREGDHGRNRVEEFSALLKGHLLTHTARPVIRIYIHRKYPENFVCSCLI
jgi:hypothetical protein